MARKVSAMLSSHVSGLGGSCGVVTVGNVRSSCWGLSGMVVKGEIDRDKSSSPRSIVNGESDRGWGSGDGARSRLAVSAETKRPTESRRLCRLWDARVRELVLGGAVTEGREVGRRQKTEESRRLDRRQKTEAGCMD